MIKEQSSLLNLKSGEESSDGGIMLTFMNRFLDEGKRGTATDFGLYNHNSVPTNNNPFHINILLRVLESHPSRHAPNPTVISDSSCLLLSWTIVLLRCVASRGDQLPHGI